MESIKYIKLDRGKSTSLFPNEKGTCSITAIANAFDVDYTIAYDYMTSRGRKFGEGKIVSLPPEVLGKKITAVKPLINIDIKEFCKKFKDYNTIVCIKKHTFAICRGIVYDTFPPREDYKIKRFWIVQ